ncbi:MAG: flagellar basal body P-ring formation chaperone FlgA [Candidatus Competibacteraceae bacterium]|jgi:flagella basal body P-ring formation protein FlgA
MSRIEGFLILFACSGGLVTFAMADSALQPLGDIQRAAHIFLKTQHQGRAEPPQIRLQPLDPRLRLPPCRVALEAFLPSGAKNVGNASIGVRCPDPAWTVYQRATIYVYDQVLVAQHFLRRGAILSPADLRAERRELSALPGGYETDSAQIIGKQLRQALMAGMVISPRDVKMPPAVRQGEVITLVVRQGGMEVTSSGVALSDASIGERVRARNEASQRVVEGIVIHQRRVEVGK